MYEDLLKQAEEKIQLVDELFKQSDLPDSPDLSMAERQLVELRGDYYDAINI